MSRSSWIYTVSVAWLLGCASSNNCMRNSDCMPEARCIRGTCLVPPSAFDTAGTAGIYLGTTASNRGGTAPVTSALGGSAAMGGSVAMGGSGGAGAQAATAGAAGTAGAEEGSP